MGSDATMNSLYRYDEKFSSLRWKEFIVAMKRIHRCDEKFHRYDERFNSSLRWKVSSFRWKVSSFRWKVSSFRWKPMKSFIVTMKSFIVTYDENSSSVFIGFHRFSSYTMKIIVFFIVSAPWCIHPFCSKKCVHWAQLARWAFELQTNPQVCPTVSVYSFGSYVSLVDIFMLISIFRPSKFRRL
jgi:hypothetical protein